MIDIRKIKVWLMRNRNLINFLKIVIIVLLSIVNNTNEKFVENMYQKTGQRNLKSLEVHFSCQERVNFHMKIN